MRCDDPPDTWTGTPRGQGNSRWAGGDGHIEHLDKDEEMITPHSRRMVKQKPPPELSLTPTTSSKQVPPAISVLVGMGAKDPLAGQHVSGSDVGTTFMLGCLFGVGAALGKQVTT